MQIATTESRVALVAPTSRITEVGGRVYPVNRRTCRLTNLPHPFPSILESTLSALPFARLGKDAPEQAVYEGFTKSIHFLRTQCEEWKRMLLNTLETAVEIRTDNANAPQSLELALQKLKQLQPLLPQVRFDVPDLLDWNLAARPVDEIHAALARHLEATARRQLEGFADALDQSHQQRIVGLIEWHPDKTGVCRYEFHRFVVVQEQLDIRTAATTREAVKRTETPGANHWEERTEVWRGIHTERDLCRTDRSARHEHHLYKANAHAWNDRSVEMPGWVARYLDVLPPWLGQHVQIVAGNMLREIIVETDTAVKRWTEEEDKEALVSTTVRSGRLWSPAVVLGHWVLCGWSDRDLEDERRQH